MTLILSRVSSSYATQVTDRLITTGTGQEIDTRSNKNILYACADAIVSIAYTGIAFLNDVPTDQWLVETITRRAFDRARKPPVFGPTDWLSSEGIGQTMMRLRTALEHGSRGVPGNWTQQWRSLSFDLFFVGWHWNNRGRFRPIVGWVSKKPGATNFELGYRNRLWHYRQAEGVPYMVGAVPSSNYSEDEGTQLRQRLQNKSWQETEVILVQEVQRVAGTRNSVGRGALSITLSPPDTACAIVKDFPETSRFHKIESSFVANLETEVHLHPWLVGPGLVRPPALLSHSEKLQLGRYVVTLVAPDSAGPMFMGSLQRPRV